MLKMGHRVRNCVTCLLGVGILLVGAPAVAERSDGPDDSRPGWLGVFLNDAVDGGAELVALVSQGPAQRAGLRLGDVVVMAGDVRVSAVEDFTRALARRVPGDELRLLLIRGGRRLDLSVMLGDRPEAGGPATCPSLPPSASD